MKNQEKPERVLCIVGSMDAGGAETFLMKIYRNLDTEKYQMDFLVSNPKEGYYDKEILSYGGRIYKSVPKTKKPLKSFLNIIKITQKNKYKNVMRISQHSVSAFDLLLARIGGANNLIFRSSNSKTGEGKVSEIIHKMFIWLPKLVPTVKIAPSTEAAIFMFGKKAVNKREVNIIKNAVKINDFTFDRDKRKAIRKELSLENQFVIGHIGRFSNQKNHSYLIDIFYEIYKQNNESKLVLVGKGELENKIKEKVEELNLTEQVIFTGVKSNIPTILMGFDVFVFPSFFEGMPNTVIEAQATGLPCIISDRITKEVKITNLVNFKSIDSEPREWSENILSLQKNINRKGTQKEFSESGYDITAVTEELTKLIFK